VEYDSHKQNLFFGLSRIIVLKYWSKRSLEICVYTWVSFLMEKINKILHYEYDGI
jgi:hypothetical protein